MVFAIAAFTSAEIRRGLERNKRGSRSGARRHRWRLAGVAAAATVRNPGHHRRTVPARAAHGAHGRDAFPVAPRLTGFSNVVDLGGFGKISRDDRAVMHVLPYSRAAAARSEVARRGAEPFRRQALVGAARCRTADPDARTATPKSRTNPQRSRRDGHRLIYRVDLQNSGTGTLFIAGIPEFINIDATHLVATPGERSACSGPLGETLRYEVSAHSGPPLPRN